MGTRKRKPAVPPKQMNLFTPQQLPRNGCPLGAAPVPPPPPTSATVTEQLPPYLLEAGWRIVWRTDRYADGWFYAINDALGQQTFDHIYVKHRGYKFAIVDIGKGRTTAIIPTSNRPPELVSGGLFISQRHPHL